MVITTTTGHVHSLKYEIVKICDITSFVLLSFNVGLYHHTARSEIFGLYSVP